MYIFGASQDAQEAAETWLDGGRTGGFLTKQATRFCCLCLGFEAVNWFQMYALLLPPWPRPNNSNSLRPMGSKETPSGPGIPMTPRARGAILSPFHSSRVLPARARRLQALLHGAPRDGQRGRRGRLQRRLPAGQLLPVLQLQVSQSGDTNGRLWFSSTCAFFHGL